MHIDHVALYSLDIDRIKDFYITYFQGKLDRAYHNPNTGLRTYFLSFDSGCRLEIMTRPELLDETIPSLLPGYAHLAVAVPNRAALDALTARLHEDGYPVVSGPRVTGDGYYESCVLDPDGNCVELVALQ